jgi:hypothetical protein
MMSSRRRGVICDCESLVEGTYDTKYHILEKKNVL